MMLVWQSYRLSIWHIMTYYDCRKSDGTKDTKQFNVTNSFSITFISLWTHSLTRIPFSQNAIMDVNRSWSNLKRGQIDTRNRKEYQIGFVRCLMSNLSSILWQKFILFDHGNIDQSQSQIHLTILLWYRRAHQQRFIQTSSNCFMGQREEWIRDRCRPTGEDQSIATMDSWKRRSREFRGLQNLAQTKPSIAFGNSENKIRR
jgi:hypothetical protein